MQHTFIGFVVKIVLIIIIISRNNISSRSTSNIIPNIVINYNIIVINVNVSYYSSNAIHCLWNKHTIMCMENNFIQF